MSINISAKASEALNELLKEDANNLVRIYIKGFAWGGPKFGIVLDKTKDDEKDHVETVDGLNIVIEKDLLKMYSNFSIDYSTGILNKGFTVYTGPRTSC